MLTKETVLILGAGASKPFGFPTGLELSALVSRELQAGHNGYNRLIQNSDFTDEDISNFRNAFYFSGKNSVDAFLEHRTDLMEIGKAATAAVLMPYEYPDKLFEYENNWIRYLYNNLNTSFDEFSSNKLSIVTFNYDRTVEHFFFQSLKNSYKKTDAETRTILDSIPIIHLHGRLGYLPWQADQGTREYDFNVSRESLRIGAENIKIIHEDIKDGRDKDFSRAHELMHEAQQIFFLGFGYNKTNMDRLGVSKLSPNKAIGTALDLGTQERLSILRSCDSTIKLVDGDCLAIMREYVNWS